MDFLDTLELQDCYVCGGPGILEEEEGTVYVCCAECGSHSVRVYFDSEEEKEERIRRTVHLWNIGKIIGAGNGE